LIADWAKPERAGSQAWKLGAGEVIVTLGMLNALFLAFVAVQIRFLFGGANSVHTVAGMTYTTYARSGFFELLWVTGLVLPVLLGLDWLKSDTNVAQIRLFRTLSASLIALLFVIMASAVQRLNLYIAQFGLTELRLYSSIFMGWLAVVFCWFVATVLTGRRERFVFGALVSGLAVIIGMHIANPAAIIARTNIARIAAGHKVDVSLLPELGADAVPSLVSSVDQIKSPSQRSDIAAYLIGSWSGPMQNGWPSWTYAEYAARSAVASQRQRLAHAVIVSAPAECDCQQDNPCTQTASAAATKGH
jgi:hypothetical protein